MVVQRDVAPEDVTKGIDAAVAVNAAAELPSEIEAAVTASPDSGIVTAGERAFRKCKACHQVGKDARNRAGPALNGVYGRVAASVKGFNYSDAMKAAGKRVPERGAAPPCGKKTKPRPERKSPHNYLAR
ncbi:MAG: c-type cytochrome, partial [Boseongicola sp. SB0665_bin_10]|nr:c-type cytochrome [Boseongicola sp. SB0665_bin_10]